VAAALLLTTPKWGGSLIATFAPDFESTLAHHEVLGPPDIEARIGLTGGNIFQGETMPDQMWEHRLPPGRHFPASTCAAPPPTPPAPSSRSTGATPPWPCSRTRGSARGLSDPLAFPR
jgi:hypothetical protein